VSLCKLFGLRSQKPSVCEFVIDSWTLIGRWCLYAGESQRRG